MLDIRYIREHPEELKQNIKNRQLDLAVFDVDKLLQLDKSKNDLQKELDALRQKRKAYADAISQTKDAAKRQESIAEAKALRDQIKAKEDSLSEIQFQWQTLMDLMPNLTHSAMPVGKNSADNKEIKVWGDKPTLPFPAKHHLDLAEALDIADVQKASQVSGSRFYYLKNQGVELEFALFNWVFQKIIKKGFVPMIPPMIVKERALYGTGYFPAEKDQVYTIESANIEAKENLYLTGTSEQALVSYHSDEILLDLPKKYLGYSTCFRSEAGSWGKDVRGIKRVHQFNKLELIFFTKPEDSQQAMAEALSIEEEILQELGLPYHILEMSTGDVGLPTYRKNDVEVWLPSQQEYCETMSNSDLDAYHARRLNIRYQKEDGTKDFVHTVSATAITDTRIILAILDNFQQPDGSIKIPEVLHPYLSRIVIQKEK